MPIFPNQYPEKLNPKNEDKILLADSESGSAIKSVQAKKVADLVLPITNDKLADNSVTASQIADGVLDLKSKMILLTRDGTASAGDVSYTGVGFRPTSIHFFMVVAGTNYHSKGASDANKDARCLFCAGNNVFYPADRPVIYSNQTAWAQGAYVKSYDEDGFTLAWLKTGTPPAGTLTIMALCYQ